MWRMEADPPPELRFLKLLVAALAATMIAGILAIVTLLALRLPGQPPPLALPEGLTLPPGARAEALSFGRDWVVVLTEDGAALVYDRATGDLRNRVTLRPGAP
jgi:hypothetical protein